VYVTYVFNIFSKGEKLKQFIIILGEF